MLFRSKEKMQFGKRVSFAGMIISSEGISPDPGKVDALTKFGVPKNITDLRSFIGLANQLGMFVPDLAHVLEPLRELTSPKKAFVWIDVHQKAFEDTIRILTDENGHVLKPFNPALETILTTDASKSGLGFVLQQSDKAKRYMVCCGSRSLTPAERNYAPLELQALVFSLQCPDVVSTWLEENSRWSLIINHLCLFSTRRIWRQWKVHGCNESWQSVLDTPSRCCGSQARTM